MLCIAKWVGLALAYRTRTAQRGSTYLLQHTGAGGLVHIRAGLPGKRNDMVVHLLYRCLLGSGPGKVTCNASSPTV
jgi:hypothetical protein